MKHLFKEGKFIEVDGIKRLEFVDNDEQMNDSFKRSAFKMTNLVSLCDFKKYRDTDYYYIYREYGFTGTERVDYKEIEKSIKKILDGNNEDVINYKNLTLGCGYTEIENDVFWDVNNNIIITKGEEALRNMCVELVMSGFERLGVKRTKETEELYLSNAIDVPMIVKLFKLDPTQRAEENRKILKLIHN